MKPFILSSLLALSAVAFSTAQAIPTPQPITINLVNTGDQSIYYALTSNAYDYTSFLSIQVNGLADKNDVVGVIKPYPYGSVELILTPLPNFYKFSQNPWMNYNFSFAHSLTSARARLNLAPLSVQFNEFPAIGPYVWNVTGWANAIICTSGTCDIDSDSSLFVY